MLRKLIVPAYTVGIVGALMQVWGGIWDVSWHILGLVETFFTLPHTILYSGIALSLLAALSAVIFRFRFRASGPVPETRLLVGLHVALAGGIMQLLAGPLDFWWHSNFGFDPFLFTPPHGLLILGIVTSGLGMAIGSATLLQAHRTNILPSGFLANARWLNTLTIVALATLWIDLNGFVYLVTDADGIAYTFRLSENFMTLTGTPAFLLGTVLLSLTGVAIIVTARNVLGWRGAAILVTAIVMVVQLTADLGFRTFVLLSNGAGEVLARPENALTGTEIASFIPLYLAFFIPVALFDIAVRNTAPFRIQLLGAALVAPFASFLDGFFGVILWSRLTETVPILLLPMFVVGILVATNRSRLQNLLLLPQIDSMSQTLKQ
jgi:hypothetical protein